MTRDILSDSVRPKVCTSLSKSWQQTQPHLSVVILTDAKPTQPSCDSVRYIERKVFCRIYIYNFLFFFFPNVWGSVTNLLVVVCLPSVKATNSNLRVRAGPQSAPLAARPFSMTSSPSHCAKEKNTHPGTVSRDA